MVDSLSIWIDVVTINWLAQAKFRVPAYNMFYWYKYLLEEVEPTQGEIITIV